MKNPIRICLISREYPPLTHVGGIGTYSFVTARLLARKGHIVHVITTTAGKEPTSPKTCSDGIIVHRLSMLFHALPAGKFWFPFRKWCRSYLPRFLDALTWARTVHAYLAQPDLYHAFDIIEYPETMGEGLLVSRPPGCRLICRIHSSCGNTLLDNPLELLLILAIQRRSCRRAHRVLCPSHYMIRHYARATLLLSQRIFLNRNPVEVLPIPVDWKCKSLRHALFVGRIEPNKGAIRLLHALREYWDSGEDLHVRIVGGMNREAKGEEKAYQERFMDMIRECRESLQGNPARRSLEYLGPLPHDELYRQYDWAGILFIPSVMENYPYVAWEGLSRGCYILASHVGGLPEIIERPALGMLIPSKNYTLWTAKIRECMGKEGSILDGLKENVDAFNREFTPDTCYRRLLEGFGPPT